MAETTKGMGQSMIGALGALFIGAAILLFVVTLVLNNLKSTAGTGDTVANRAAWNTTNSSIDSLLLFMRITVILLGVSGVTMVGGFIIQYISGIF
jgi:hypothetical protein